MPPLQATASLAVARLGEPKPSSRELSAREERGRLLAGEAEPSDRWPKAEPEEPDEAESEERDEIVLLPRRAVAAAAWNRREALLGLALALALAASARLGQSAAAHIGRARQTAASSITGLASSSACRDPEPGEHCFESVAWVMQTGIYESPEWFEGLDSEARFEEVQAFLHEADSAKPEEEKSLCAPPCKDASRATRYKGIPGSALDLPVPGPYAERTTLEFYAYRAQGDSEYPLENVDIGDLPGVMWYLHNEIVVAVGRSRKYGVTRIKRFKIRMTTSWAYYNSHRRQFGSFVAFDNGHCTVPGCDKIWTRFGFLPGCQHVDTERLRAAYMSDVKTFVGEDCEGYKCNPPVWYSLPGPCPNHNYDSKSDECTREFPGGLCDSATGERDCTYSVEDAGEVGLDKVTGIDDYVKFFNEGGLEYSERRDEGEGCSFWDGKKDEAKCKERVDFVKKLFDETYPNMQKCDELPTPPCDTDGYYAGELEASLSDWPVYEDGSIKLGDSGKLAQEISDTDRTNPGRSEGSSTSKVSSTQHAATKTSAGTKSTSTTREAPLTTKTALAPMTSPRTPAPEGPRSSSVQDEVIPPKGHAYTITLDHSKEEPLGLAVEMVDEAIVIDAVTGGLFRQWNDGHPDEQVERGDLIVAVNDVRGSSDKLAAELRKSRVLMVELQPLEPHHSGATRSHFRPGLSPQLEFVLMLSLGCALWQPLSGMH